MAHVTARFNSSRRSDSTICPPNVCCERSQYFEAASRNFLLLSRIRAWQTLKRSCRGTLSTSCITMAAREMKVSAATESSSSKYNSATLTYFSAFCRGVRHRVPVSRLMAARHLAASDQSPSAWKTSLRSSRITKSSSSNDTTRPLNFSNVCKPNSFNSGFFSCSICSATCWRTGRAKSAKVDSSASMQSTNSLSWSTSCFAITLFTSSPNFSIRPLASEVEFTIPERIWNMPEPAISAWGAPGVARCRAGGGSRQRGTAR
mmetsp:Transcript_76215/g.202395  ORF Transcript_76215/g.202395 Transcript_76215/m.202395 type:complete len:261 (+) Transcript_76215:596-1378(+)